MNIYDLLLLPENFIYAWQKVRRLCDHGDGYIDHAEISRFEINLEDQLQSIRNDFSTGSYKPGPLRALPRPKKIQGGAIDRQYFHVSVRDQVAWIAIINAVGPALDKKMPAWSYGNRLYRAAWYERSDNAASKLEVGPYRHASGNLYRKFQQSWPLFRRHVAMTAKNMVRKFDPLELDQSDERAAAAAEADGLPYLETNFWNRSRRGVELYHASLDLKEFFPSVSTDSVLRGFDFGIDAQSGKAEVLHLIKSMLSFNIQRDIVPEYLLAAVSPELQYGEFNGIPTGLFVAGFLANTALLPVDAAMDQQVKAARNIAHFRFVDDHSLIAYDFDELCQWITQYQTTLALLGIDAKVNTDKTDPQQLADWLDARALDASNPLTVRETASAACKIDGSNPTPLLTKTLAQVSAIATTNADVLDDDDIAEQLKLLEWLLLADLPEREIRPDTRAAFAAGQIAKLAPILLQEENGLVDLTRDFAAFEAKNSSGSNKQLKSDRQELAKRISALSKAQKRGHDDHLRHCFSLLMQAFEAHPAKARLFHRLHDYCRLTGYSGLSRIDDWIKAIKRSYPSWASYYAGLSLQIIAGSIPRAVTALLSNSALRSDVSAAHDYLSQIASLRRSAFLIAKDEEAWFQRHARREIAYAAYAASLILRPHRKHLRLAEKLLSVSNRFETIDSDYQKDNANEHENQYSAGVWAHLLESRFATGPTPSPIWEKLQRKFDYSNPTDLSAVRRYPRALPDPAWEALISSNSSILESDGGWVLEAIEFEPERIQASLLSHRRAFSRAAKVVQQHSSDWLTAKEWSKFTIEVCDPFDPRRSEWTALEIIRQLLLPVQDFSFSVKDLEGIHPYNVTVSSSWVDFSSQREGLNASWEEWRHFAKRKKAISLLGSADRIKDYRYQVPVVGEKTNPWYPHLRSIGQLLLGLLASNHSTPISWNLRGNEILSNSGRAKQLRSLPISSPTIIILDSCLSGRSAETRTILSQPTLFGLRHGDTVKDTKFDAAPLVHPEDLLSAVVASQSVLESNQIAVSLNQPRQLIPFRLKDFSAASESVDEDHNA